MKTLPDYLPEGSKLVIVGCNPSLTAARTGFYYSGRGNQFWSLLYDSGLVPEPLVFSEAQRVTEFGIGLTDLVKRPTKGSDGLSKRDFDEGREILRRKLEMLGHPRIIAFNGKIVYEQFFRRKCSYGLHNELLFGAKLYILPSTSTRCARMFYSDKLQHFLNLRELMRAPEVQATQNLENQFASEAIEICA